MKEMKYPLTLFSSKDAEKIARSIYGIPGTCKKLPGELDQNFHLKSTAGTEFKLKIAHPSENRTLVELQNKTMKSC